MGAVENAEPSGEDDRPELGVRVEQKLADGWRIVSLPDGQLLLIPPGPGAYDAA